MLGMPTLPAVVTAAAAADDRHWLLNHFEDPRPRLNPWSRALARGIGTIARGREARRRARGGAFRLAVANEPRRDAWAEEVPYLDPVVLPIAGVREVAPEPDARIHLGLAENARIALLFGDRWAKDRETVLAAFCRLPAWTLVIAGRVADGLAPSTNVVTMPGPVSDKDRDRLFAAADLMVLSFTPGYRSNSGTLMDAISFGVPVVCTADADAATIVEQFCLGECFEGGDVGSLVDAVQRAPATIAPADLESARGAHCNRAVARRQLSAMGIPDRAT
jgi:glycosyltransferase involved in cell wall biosynthesis